MRYLIFLLFFASGVSAQPLAVTNTFSNNTVADATEINENFDDIVTGVNAKLRTDNAGPYATAVGFEALKNNTGSYNTAVGLSALYRNEDGDYNTALGASALSSNRNGGQNTGLGYWALKMNTEGNYNTAVGNMGLFSNTGGDHNTASGSGALYSNMTGDNNTASGSNALATNTEGHQNTAVGSNALYYNEVGGGNTAIGYGALAQNTSGENNTAIGRLAGAVGDFTNTTAIGYGAFVSADNTIKLGNPSVTGVYTSGSYFSNGSAITSDERLKTDIVEIGTGLPLINDLNPVAYRRINNEGLGIELGLLAQDVASTLARHGLADSGMVIQPDDKGYLYLRYNDLLAPMIKAIQELDDASEAKDEQIALLEQRLESQQEELLAIVQSQQEQIAQLQRMMGEQFAAR